MKEILSFLEVNDLIDQLSKGKVIVYPTESVFGLGCDPDNKNAIYTLLQIKNRSWTKGLILIASSYAQLSKYIDDRFLNKKQRLCIISSWPSPITWLLPARINTPYWLTGQSSFIAVRISNFKPIQDLCSAFGKPLISTSANLSGFDPARTIEEVQYQFGRYHLSIMQESVLGRPNPSEIRDVITRTLVRR